MGQGPDRRLIILGVFALLAVGIVGAILIGRSGGGGDDSTASADSTAASETTTGEESAAASAGKKPKVTVPKGPPPKKLEIREIIKGDGPVAKTNDYVTVHYVGVGYDSKEEFDASWDRGEPFPFNLGSGEVIKGWDQGLAGMRVGGRRELIIPPNLAYGAAGSPPAIGKNEALVFVVDLLAAE
jgi:peptidylprolyl isomerase